MSDSADADVTRDAFLGGALQIAQPKAGYRAGIDPVLLAASLPARPGERVLELGCGAGVAALCLGRRVQGVHLTGLEIQPGYADLARDNATCNRIDLEVITGDLANLPADLRTRHFDHVMANPPYFDRAASTPATDSGRETALGESTPLAAWVAAAAKRTAPRGTVTFIQRAERLPELLGHAAQHLGSLEVLPLVPRAGQPARLVLLRGRRGGRAAFKLHNGWVLHAGDRHEKDGDSYTMATTAVLRLGAALPFPA
ncbi:tRNA1(Val) (adenine(37)-N6)-methyltransferase [Roseovarius aestuariivivens]|uniref:tRNA1(Val) (adenine(37)-N6)-methyltransferase n=1 Tax=Roseovarius aestuariivivens TaxID=1888910 RepID=UPI001081DE4F|nr:methyltransferase [Roseovarius aestuariivivens]